MWSGLLRLDVWIINRTMSSFRQVPTPPRASPRKGEAGNRCHRVLMNIRNNIANTPEMRHEKQGNRKEIKETSHIFSQKMDYHVLHPNPNSLNWLPSPTVFWDASLGMNAMGPEGCRSPILRSQSATVERSSSVPGFDGLTDSHDSMNQY